MTFKVPTPKSKKRIDPKELEAFAGKTDTPATPAQSAGPYPWENPNLRGEKRTEAFNIRFTEIEKAKLAYIAEHSPDSAHAFCLKVLLPAIDAKIKELTGK